MSGTEQTKIDILNSCFEKIINDNRLTNPRIQIETELISVMGKLKSELNETQRIFDNIESRIKTLDSFKQKVKRKNYVTKWNVPDSNQSESVEAYICKNLTDIIGFRINCFFMKDEEYIFEKIRRYYSQNVFSKLISLSFDENNHQDNGHEIYKFSGIYDNKYSFEVQIKSIMHNLWGEVEHKTVYKNKKYDGGIIPKRAIIEEVFNVLSASDKQLVTLFAHNVTQEKLIQTLFFFQSNELVKKKIEVMAKHYSLFFRVFGCENKLIIDYVGRTLLGEIYVKNQLPSTSNHDLFDCLKSRIEKDYNAYDIECIYEILNVLIYQINIGQARRNMLQYKYGYIEDER